MVDREPNEIRHRSHSDPVISRSVRPIMKSSVSMCNVHEEFHKEDDISNGSDVDKRFEDGSDSDSNKEVHSDEEDGEISVGCPSPVNDFCNDVSRDVRKFNSDEEDTSRSSSALTCRRRLSLEESEDNVDYSNEDYFTPLKKLKMMQIDKMKYGISDKANIQKIRPNKLAHAFVDIPNELTRPDDLVEDLSSKTGSNGVKSFSIHDILNHHPKSQAKDKKAATQPTRIVRPWDTDEGSSASFQLAPPPAHCGAFSLAPPMLLDPRYHRLHVRPKSVDFCSTYESCSSGRSSAGGSDYCTSPDIINSTSPNSSSSGQPRRAPSQPRKQSSGEAKSECSPLELLVEMTAKPFDKMKGETGQDAQGNPLNLFNSRQQAKKKRKSRTAFTNVQIMELERRFIHQKYLSPADRDEIAYQLRLTNAQVITWFQNRRAKLKRDMEERAKDVRATEVLTGHSAFFENAQNMALLKKKPVVNKEVD
nr:PREDICTED: uncharacterized protein LOC109038001 [Bemisia tabaci]